ncbi:hypothetical protein WG66_002395 [Moniliophthora roreri]|nr:hypothetical protein WG66_002395 [Moniliophthora roreri]
MSPKVLIEKSKGSKGKGLAIRGRAHPYVLPAGQRHYRGQPLTSKTGKTGRHPQPEDPNNTMNEIHFYGPTMFARTSRVKIIGSIFNNMASALLSLLIQQVKAYYFLLKLNQTKSLLEIF